MNWWRDGRAKWAEAEKDLRQREDRAAEKEARAAEKEARAAEKEARAAEKEARAAQKDAVPNRDPLGNFIKGAPLWLGLLVLLKIIGVSSFSLTTASALVTVAPVPVLLGTLVLYEPVFIGAFAALCLWFIIQLRARRITLAVPLVSVVAFFAILLTPLPVLYLVILAAAITWLVYSIPHAPWFRYIYDTHFRRYWFSHIVRRSTIKDYRPARPSPVSIVVSIVALLLGSFLILTIDIPWLPAEVVGLKQPIANFAGGEMVRAPVVYIISEQNGTITMLVDDGRDLVSVPSADVEWRKICYLNGLRISSVPLIWVILGRRTTSLNVGCWRLTDDPVERANH